MASPFLGNTFIFTQPDGTTFRVRGWGDQHYAVFETLDGYTIVRNPSTGFYEIAQLSSDTTMLVPAPGPQGNLDGPGSGTRPGLRIIPEAARLLGLQGAMQMGGRRCDQRRNEHKNLARAARTLGGPVMAPPRRTTVGDFVGLCLLIDFPDELGTVPKSEVENFCNERGYSGFGNNGSVADYFRDNSLGRCRYSNIVTDYYCAKNPKSYYTDPRVSYGTRARQLINEALNHLLDTDFDFSPLTADSHGYIYAVNVYYAGEAANNWQQGLWPHAWHLGTPVSLASGKSAFDYQFTNMSDQLSLGTFCHENGHMLCDYPDLYDYGGESSGAGAYCLMCSGGNLNEKNPTQICAYLKRLSGWATSISQLRHNQQIELSSSGNNFAMFSKDSGEYFIIENRLKSGRDKDLPDEGLAIWHVDEDGSNNNEAMEPASHYELSLEQADGLFQLESSRYHFGNSTDLFGRPENQFSSSTRPNSNWWNGATSNLDIYDISPPGDTVRFKVRLEPGETERVHGESNPAVAIPDYQADGVTDTITFDRDGEIIGVTVTVDITHSYRGDLQVTLLTPWAESAVLHHRRQGGSADHLQRTYDSVEIPALSTLYGQNCKGQWKLQVQDLAPADVGTLNRWALDFDICQRSPDKIILRESPGAHIPDNDPEGITRKLSTASSARIGSLEIDVDITHTWSSDLKISISSPSGIKVILHDREGGSGDNVVKTFTSTTTPLLGNLAGLPIAGEWQLQVIDLAGRDVGKLNSWRLMIQPAV